MAPLRPGQAILTRYQGHVLLVICDRQDVLIPIKLAGSYFGLRGGIDLVEVNGTCVPVVFAVIRLTSPGSDLFYTAWVNELATDDGGILESLATQPILPTLLVDSDGKKLAVNDAPNLLRELAHKSLRIVSELAVKQAWTPQHFAFARAATEYEWPTASSLWEMLERRKGSPSP
jgi:hypothetical protein